MLSSKIKKLENLALQQILIWLPFTVNHANTTRFRLVTTPLIFKFKKNHVYFMVSAAFIGVITVVNFWLYVAGAALGFWIDGAKFFFQMGK